MSLPAGPMVTLATALEARYTLLPRDGRRREVAAIDFVTGNHANVLAPGELLSNIHLPARALRKRFASHRSSLPARRWRRPRLRSLRCAATDKICRGAPGMPRQRLQASHSVSTSDRVARSQRSIRNSTECRAAVSTLQFGPRFRTMLSPRESLRDRRCSCIGGSFCIRRPLLLAPRDRGSANGWRRGNFTGDRGCDSHGLPTQLRGAHIVGLIV